MKNLIKLFQLLFTVVLLSLCIAASVATVFDVPAAPVFWGSLFLFSLPFQATEKGPALMAIQKEIWVNYIIENLFKNNGFLQRAFNDDEFVLQGKVVHIPQAGGKPTVVKNRNSFPATAVRRTDVDIAYVLDEFSTDPTHIQNAEMVELSYNKIDSVIGEHVATLGETIGDHILINWLQDSAAGSGAAGIAAAPVLRTTGAAVAAHMPGATGNRLLITRNDFKAARTHLNKLNIPNENRFALVSADMLDQLMNDSVLETRDSALELDMRSGTIGRLYGFELLERSYVATYDNAATPAVKAVGAASAGTDNDAAIFWQQNAVARALGTVDFFEDQRNPLYYGDIYSALIRMGGRKRRQNAEGIVAVVQAPSA